MGMKNKFLMGALLLATSAVWAAPAATGIDQYELSSFVADFTHFKLAIPFLSCTAPTSTILSNGSNAICQRPTQEPTGPIWAALMY